MMHQIRYKTASKIYLEKMNHKSFHTKISKIINNKT